MVTGGQYFCSFLGGRKRGMKRVVPNRLMNLDNRAKRIDPTLLPTTEEAVQLYPGTISEPCSFGTDPLEFSASKKNIRSEAFYSRFSFETLFGEVSNGCGASFTKALLFLIDTTYRLSSSS